MLKITTANDPITINQLVLVLYGLPGVGKSVLAYTADKPLLLDFDKGAYRAGNRKDTVQIETWADVANMTAADLAPYNTIVVDTVGRALDSLTGAIIAENPKNARGSGDLTLQGFGVLKAKFIAWLKLMRGYGKDVVLVGHMDEKQEGDIVKERIDAQGGSKTEIYKSADAIGKLYIEGKIRKLDFSPREGSLGKNPGQFDVLTVPDYRQDGAFLGTVVQNIKDSINKLSEQQKQQTALVDIWKQWLAEISTPEEFNALLPKAKAKETPQIVKELYKQASRDAGLKFDIEADKFYRPAKEPPAVDPAPVPEQAPPDPASNPSHSRVTGQLQGSLAITPPMTPESGNGAKAGKENRFSNPPTHDTKDDCISVAQIKRLFAIAKNNEQRVRDIAGRHGFEHISDITKRVYDDIVRDLE